ncbi:hypothetical protein GCM10019016_020700 [Streptomyces prasinosporus]|uniref:DUF4267 domain-containing protein n=1 Tax=Streptomyces prasinosporus TaxID=68256 RepID=A0ABP6TJF7_9ACTN
MRTGLLRALGAATCAYGIALVYRPGLLARPLGLVGPHGRADPHDALAVRPMAWRDAATGLAMLVAPEGAALTTATAVRIASDVGDAVLFGAALSGRVRRAGAAVSALGWAALAVAGLTGGHRAAGDRPDGRHGPRRPHRPKDRPTSRYAKGVPHP